LVGSFSELLGNLEEAMQAYERALHANPNSVPAMNAISLILRTREEFHKAVDYLQGILKIDANNGEVWGSLGKPARAIHIASYHPTDTLVGHCFLMMDDLQQAYAAYQNALINLPNPKVTNHLSSCETRTCPYVIHVLMIV
jgi:glucose repression mediator protein